jgi:hypothetical protein
MMGQFEPKPPIFDGKNNGFRCRFSREHQSIASKDNAIDHGANAP